MTTNRVAEIGALIGDPARAAMLTTLMDGRALTASELADAAGITRQTASSHLSKLVRADLLGMTKQGRHRYFSLGSQDVARMLEGMMQISSVDVRPVVTGPRDAAMRRVRSCYDHMAGGLAVAITDALQERGIIEFEAESGLITASGLTELASMGIVLGAGANPKKRSSRPLCRPCLDWSERRPHVAGQLGAALLTHFQDRNLVRRRAGEARTLYVTPKGARYFRDVFGIAPDA